MRVAKWIGLGAVAYIAAVFVSLFLFLPAGAAQIMCIASAIAVGVVGYRRDKARATGAANGVSTSTVAGLGMLRLKWIGIGLGIWFGGGLVIGLAMTMFGLASMGSGLISGIAGAFIGIRGYNDELQARRGVTPTQVMPVANPRDIVNY